MEGKILVAYASKYGSTREAAEAIAMTLREKGFAGSLAPMRKVRDLTGYRALVLGAPLYFGSWHKDAFAFLERHQEALVNHSPEDIHTAIFALGPTHADEKEWQGSRLALQKGLAKFPWLTPMAVEVFGGRYDPARLNLVDKWIASLPASPLNGLPASDVLDLDAVRSWGLRVATQLRESVLR